MPKNSILLIVNPNADKGRTWRTASDLRPVVDDMGGADWTGTVYPTHAIDLAQQAGEDGYQMVVAVGGDGTVHEVINGLMRVNESMRPQLGVVPMGRGNDFAHSLGISPVAVEALSRLWEGRPRRVDLGLLRDGRGRMEYWNNTLGIGFDATATLRSREIPVLTGFPVYFVAVIQTIMMDNQAPKMIMKVDGEAVEENPLMMVMCNGPREGGGFLVSPESKPDDGVLDCISISQVSRLKMFRLVPEVMRGTHLRFPEICSRTFSKIEINSDRPLYIHTDGEIFAGFGVDVRQISVELLPGAIDVVV